MRHPGNEIAKMAASAVRQSKSFQRSIGSMVSDLAMDAASRSDSEFFLPNGILRLWFHGHVVQDINILDLMADGASKVDDVTDIRPLQDALMGVERFESVLELMRQKIEARLDALATPDPEASSENTSLPNTRSS